MVTRTTTSIAQSTQSSFSLLFRRGAASRGSNSKRGPRRDQHRRRANKRFLAAWILPRVVEIGRSYNPIAPKANGRNTTNVDHATRAELIEKYCGHGVDVNRIENVTASGPTDHWPTPYPPHLWGLRRFHREPRHRAHHRTRRLPG